MGAADEQDFRGMGLGEQFRKKQAQVVILDDILVVQEFMHIIEDEEKPTPTPPRRGILYSLSHRERNGVRGKIPLPGREFDPLLLHIGRLRRVEEEIH